MKDLHRVKLTGQDLWEVVGGGETGAPQEAGDVMRKWKIKTGNALFVLKTTVEEDLLEHIRDVDNPKAARDLFVALFNSASVPFTACPKPG